MGKTNPYLSRKINFCRYRCSVYRLFNGEAISIKTESQKSKPRLPWVLKAFLLAIALSVVLSFASSELLDGAGIVVALIVLLLIVFVGILFDMVGVAVTAANPEPFHAMAAHKERGGKEAVQLIKDADKISNICNDIVGDICSVVAGATASIIVLNLQKSFNTQNVLISIGVTALISGITVGGKALDKYYALNNSTKIVHVVAKFLSVFGYAK